MYYNSAWYFAECRLFRSWIWDLSLSHPLACRCTTVTTPMPSMHLSQLRRWILQSPPVEWAILHLRELLIGALRQGPIPQHVAFVMDGNRRFAKSHRIETVEGHNLGFEALARVSGPASADIPNSELIHRFARCSKFATSPE